MIMPIWMSEENSWSSSSEPPNPCQGRVKAAKDPCGPPRRGTLLLSAALPASWNSSLETSGGGFPGSCSAPVLSSSRASRVDARKFFHALLRLPSGDPPEWERVKLDVPPIQADPLVTSNVIGVIEGSDPGLSGEYLVLTAHYDHMGRGPDRGGDESEDTIFNGARDNGMGVVALLAAARSLSLQRPRRSVLVIAMTAEEQGLLGSSYYVENPLVPLKQNRFVLNTDAAGFSDTGVITIFGLRRISDRTLFEEACSRFGLEAVPDPAENRDLFYRSDNIPFARKGVPALTFSPGFRILDEETMKHYHLPSDEADDDFDYEYLLKFSQAFVASARSLANADTLPVWSKGDEFEDAWRELNGGSEF